MIRLDSAGVRFGSRWVFRNLDLVVTEGACLALLGPNGRGKTTLIRAMLGVQPLHQGQRIAPTLIGYVPQVGSAPAQYRVLDMVVMGRAKALGVFGVPTPKDYEAARLALGQVGLSAFSERSFSHLSGGERQLVLVARALATGAKTIILDEPSSALDLANQSRLLSLIRELSNDPAYTVVFSTHHPQHAFHLADEAALMMQDGVVRGPVETILTETNLRALYGVEVRRLAVPGGSDVLVPMLDALHDAQPSSHAKPTITASNCAVSTNEQEGAR
ncbi:ABC transporter ATP-binding protein [Ensifer sp. NPDC090286]|uniref:ABC transporter ATP-binding protein n=1 Tax=Ensifer sp. NPDC090286 TaxID=3363991 RepID=UPI00383A829D